MTKICLATLLLLQSVCYSQKQYAENDINYVRETYSIFEKNSWKPFTGLCSRKDSTDTVIIKVKNGFNLYSEAYRAGTSELYMTTTTSEFESHYDTLNRKALLRNLRQLDISEIKFRKTLVYYNKASRNSTPKRIDGHAQHDRVKTFYRNGIMVTIEKYHDQAYKQLKERIVLFHTPLGNLMIEDGDEVFHQYQKWDQTGKLIATGTYKNSEYLDDQE